MTGLSALITCWYQQLYTAKVYDKAYCYNIVCKLVHSIFEELHLFRSVDRDAYMGTGTGIKFDTNSWATICFHETMAQIVRYKFDDHPYC